MKSIYNIKKVTLAMAYRVDVYQTEREFIVTVTHIKSATVEHTQTFDSDIRYSNLTVKGMANEAFEWFDDFVPKRIR